MIASLDGTVVRASRTDSLVARGRRRRLPGLLRPGHAQPGSRRARDLQLHTHHLVREDLQALYGFRTAEELGFFELLITVTGVGPKVGLAIVSSRPVPDLQLAILQGDEAVLTAVSGVGKRLAARIVLELKEKVAAAGWRRRARRRVGARGDARIGGRGGAPGPWLHPVGGARGGPRRRSPAAAGASLEDRVKAALRTPATAS